MDKNLHDIDELFRSGLDEYEETPSTGVKETLDAALDKQDAEKYKKRFILWKRAALLLLLLLAGLVLYESGIIKTGSGGSTAKNIATDGNEVSTTGSNKIMNQDKNIPADSNNESVSADNTLTQKSIAEDQQIKQQNASAEGTTIFTGNKTGEQKNKQTNNLFFPFIQKQGPLFSLTASEPGKKITTSSNDDDGLPFNKQGVEPLDERASIAKVVGRHLKNISFLQPFTLSYTPLFINKTDNAGSKKKKSFIPFWMVTPFVSYDQAGYRLDSDEPGAVSSIKFREAHEPSFSVGLLFTRQIKQRWGLQSGLVYSNSAIGMKPQKTYAFVDPTGDIAYKYITSSGYAYFKPGFGPSPSIGDSLTTAEAKHRLEHLSIPLAIKYTVVNKKISITPGAGIEANFITKANLEVDIEDPFNKEIVVVRKLNGTKSFYWSFVADAEIKYKVNQKLSINLRPVYRTAISPITKNNVVETFPNSFGIGAGVTIKL